MQKWEFCGASLRLQPAQGRAWWVPLPLYQHCGRMEWPSQTPSTLSDLVSFKAALKFWFLHIHPSSLPYLRQVLCSPLLPQGLPSPSLVLLKRVAESRWAEQFIMVLALMESVVLWDFILFLRICKLCNKLPFCTWDRVSLCRLDWSMTLCRPNWPQTHSNPLPVPPECWD